MRLRLLSVQYKTRNIDYAQKKELPAWRMTDKRREKMNEALQDVMYQLHKQTPPTFREMQDAIDNLVYQHETNKQ